MYLFSIRQQIHGFTNIYMSINGTDNCIFKFVVLPTYKYKYKQKHNQRWFTTSMNEGTHLIKIYLSHFILERVDVSVVCERWVERHILREYRTSSYFFFQEPGGANACIFLQAYQRRLWSAACPTLDCDSLHSVQIWPRGSHHVVSLRLHTCCTRVPWSCCPVY